MCAIRSLGPQRLQMQQAVDPARIGIAPRMELQQIDPAGPKPLQRSLDRRTHVAERQRPRLRHPLREQLHRLRRARSFAQMARHDLGRPVVIGHVERGEAGVDVGAKRARGRLGVERAAVALHVGDLPQAGEHAGDGEIGGQRDPVHGGRQRHASYPGGSVAKRASRSTPWRRSFCVSRTIDDRAGGHHQEPERRRAEIPRGRGRGQIPPRVNAEKHRQHDDGDQGERHLRRARREHRDLTRERGVARGQRHHRNRHQQKVDEHRGHEDVDAEKEIAGHVAADDAERGHGGARQDRHVRRAEARMHRRDRARKDSILGPREHQARYREQHRRQVLDQRDRRTGDDHHRPRRRQQISQKTGGRQVALLRFGGDELPRHGVINRAGEEHVEDADRHDGDADRERQIAARPLGLAPRLRDRIEADERGEHQRRRRQQHRQR